MADHGFPVTRSLVKVLAVGIIKVSGRTETTTVNLEKGPSDVWWSRFKARHPELASRTADSLDRARVHGATPEAIEAFFKLYEALHVKHKLENKPHLLYNCDETGFGDEARSREKVLCQTGRKHVYQQQQTNREYITVHCCVNAAGDSIPPFIIYPGCLPSDAYRLDGPPNALYGIQEKGYMDSKLFLKWLRHLIRYAPEERPLILIMDQHETHVSKDVIMFCRENKIEIVCHTCTHHTHTSAPEYCGLQPTEDCFLHHGFQDGSGARGYRCGEEAVFSSPQTCLPHCCHSPKHEGRVPQGQSFLCPGLLWTQPRW